MLMHIPFFLFFSFFFLFLHICEFSSISKKKVMNATAFFYLEVAAHNRIRCNAWRMDRIWHTIQIKTASLFRP